MTPSACSAPCRWPRPPSCPGSPAHEVLVAAGGAGQGGVLLEHPTGTFEATVDLTTGPDGRPVIERAGIIRTARKLMDGVVFPREYP